VLLPQYKYEVNKTYTHFSYKVTEVHYQNEHIAQNSTNETHHNADLNANTSPQKRTRMLGKLEKTDCTTGTYCKSFFYEIEPERSEGPSQISVNTQTRKYRTKFIIHFND